MNPDFLAKIIRFVKEERGKFIIADSGESEAVIIMPFSEYEARRQSPLTASMESDRINRDVIIPPKELTENLSTPIPVKQEDDWGGNEPLEADSHYYMEPLE